MSSGCTEVKREAIITGIGRIGFMSGGRNAWWVDEDMTDNTRRTHADYGL
jgi:hypothetical protein